MYLTAEYYSKDRDILRKCYALIVSQTIQKFRKSKFAPTWKRKYKILKHFVYWSRFTIKAEDFDNILIKGNQCKLTNVWSYGW